nr:uncharacterized protein LOC109771816 [Aegilops tauschii subsp. strangulata]
MSLVPYAGGSCCSLPAPVPILTGENYTTWAIKVEANLDATGLWEAMVPAEDTAAAMIAKKKPALAYLLGALAEDLLLQVASKKTTAEVWSSLKVRFIGADRIRAARLTTLRSDFKLLRMENGETLDTFAGKISGMTARYAGLGSTLDDPSMVKKLLDSVPDRLYVAVTGMEQFCDMNSMPFEEPLGQLKAFEERPRRRGQAGSERADGRLMYTVAQWQAWQRRQGGGGFNDHDDDDTASTASGGGFKRRRRC